MQIVRELIQQDNCAPDAFESFEEEFVKITGMTVENFKSVATKKFKDDECCWYFAGFALYHSSDFPFYTLALAEAEEDANN
jgi:hypothetical protein